jgi:methionyl-tRNA synthetase
MSFVFVDELSKLSSWYQILNSSKNVNSIPSVVVPNPPFPTVTVPTVSAPPKVVKPTTKPSSSSSSSTTTTGTTAKYVPPPVSEAPRKRRPTIPSHSLSPKAPIPGKRNVLITSALPYVNNVPHLGNIIGCVLSADVFSRYNRMRGTNVLYVCGTDEYGTATEKAALSEGLSPRAICDKYFLLHQAIYDWFDISFDIFGRTSTPDPSNPSNSSWPQTAIAQEIFLDNNSRSNVLEQAADQFYCLDCNKALADRFVEGECPICHYMLATGDQCDGCGQTDPLLIAPRCKAVKSVDDSLPLHRVEIRTTNHLFIDLPKIEGNLTSWIDTASTKGKWTSNAMAIVNGRIKQGLKPFIITRDLKWGTPIPNPMFNDKVFYCWFDAPIGYISITACYTKEWTDWWRPDPSKKLDVQLYQFMGKDNVFFHCIIFPSCLIGTGRPYTLLHHISTCEYLNYEGGKFSKSRGQGVFGDHAMSTGIPSEVWRYHLLANRPEQSDSIFTWNDFADKTNNELIKNLGNLANRTLKLAYENFTGTVPGVRDDLDARDKELVSEANRVLSEYNTAMGEVKLKAGLRLAMELSSIGNAYMQHQEPWALAKVGKIDRCATVIALAASIVRTVAACMEPFMPGFTDKVCYQLNLDHMDIPDTFSVCIPTNHSMAATKPQPLFSAITEEQVAFFRQKFAGSQEETAAATAAALGGGGMNVAGGSVAASSKKNGSSSSSLSSSLSSTPSDPNADPISEVDLRVGVIVKAWKHPESDKLWCESIDVGDATGPREIASGLQGHFTLEQMAPRRVVVVANLKPRALAKFMSNGMVLCATSPSGKVEFVTPPEGAKIGERISFAGHVGEPAAPSRMDKKKIFETIAPGLVVGENGLCTYKGIPFMTSAGVCKVETSPAGSLIK